MARSPLGYAAGDLPSREIYGDLGEFLEFFIFFKGMGKHLVPYIGGCGGVIGHRASASVEMTGVVGQQFAGSEVYLTIDAIQKLQVAVAI